MYKQFKRVVIIDESNLQLKELRKNVVPVGDDQYGVDGNVYSEAEIIDMANSVVVD
jgi:hypothetical protein